MNKHFYRIIFNKARGMLMVVAEIVKSHQGAGRCSQKAKSIKVDKKTIVALKPITFLTYIALGVVSLSTTSYANTIVVDKNTDKTQRPIVMPTANGATQVNITAPSKGGVSHNKFTQFDVSEKGVILNNAHKDSKTALAGYVKGNDLLIKSGSAKVILNEINSKHASQLNGYIEVAGQKAQVVIANAAGITCNGCGFINANRATLTTGKPLMENGELKGYQVTQGHIAINGKGMDSSRQDYTDLIAQTVTINASLWADDVSVVSGKNTVSADLNHIEKQVDNSQEKPQLSIDVAALGGMYAGKIQLIGTESGVGVHNAGKLGASAGSITISADGKIVNSGSIQAKGNIALTSQQDIKNRKQIYSKQNVKLTSQKQIVNEGSIVAQNNIGLKANNINSRLNSTIAAGIDDKGKLTEQGNITANAKDTLQLQGQNLAHDNLIANAKEMNISQSENQVKQLHLTAQNIIAEQSKINAAGHVQLTAEKLNTNYTNISADGTIDLNASKISNQNGSWIAQDDITVITAQFDNQNAKIISAKNIHMQSDIQDNTKSILQAKGNILVNSNQLNNANMQWIAEKDITFNGKAIDNHSADIKAKQTITINANELINNQNAQLISAKGIYVTASQIDNQSASLLSNGEVNIHADNIQNEQALISAQSAITLNAIAQMNNQNSKIVTENDAFIRASELLTANATISAKGNIDITAHDINANNIHVIAEKSLIINADEPLIAQSSELKAKHDITLSATNIDLDDALIISEKVLNIDAKDTLQSNNSQFSAISALQINTNTLNNEKAKWISGDHIQIRSKAFNNTDSTLRSLNGITILAEQLDNTNTTLSTDDHITLTVLNDLNNRQAKFVAKKSILLQADNMNNQQSTMLTASSLTMSANKIHNEYSELKAQDQLRIDARQSLNNENSLLVSNQAIALSARDIDNKHAIFSSAGSIMLDADHIDNRNTQYKAKQSISIDTTSLNNQQATLASEDNISLSVVSDIKNQEAIISAKGAINIAGDTLDNTNAKLVSGKHLFIQANQANNNYALFKAEQNINLIASMLNNDNATLLAGNDIGLSSSYLSNLFAIFNAKGDIDFKSNTIINQSATLIADKAISIIAHDMDNHLATLKANEIAFNIANDLNNQSAVLLSSDDIIIEAQLLENQSAIISADGDINVTATQIENEQSKWVAKGAISLAAHDIANQKVEFKANDISILASNHLNNNHSKLLSQNAIKLSANQIENQQGAFSAKQNITINATQNINNTESLLVAGQDIVLNAQNINNAQSTLKAANNINVSAVKQLNNQQATWLAGNDISQNSVLLNNQHAAMQSNGKMTVEASQINNNDTILVAGNDLLIRAIKFDNQKASLSSKGKLTLTADHIRNHYSELISEHDLTITTTNSQNNQNAQLKAKGNITLQADSLNINQSELITENNIAVSANNIDAQKSRLLSKGNISLLATDNITNQLATIHANGNITFNADDLNNQQATIKSTQDLIITAQNIDNQRGILSANNIEITGQGINNHDGKMTSTHKLKINATNLFNTDAALLANNVDIDADMLTGDGNILSTGDLAIRLNKIFYNRGKVIANGKLSLFTQEDMYNDNIIASGDALSLTSRSFDNGQSGEISANRLNIAVNRLGNKGRIDADTLHINAQELNNIEKGRIYGNHIAIKSDTINNIGKEKGIAPVIAARESLNLAVGTLTNKEYALILSLGDLRIGRDLDGNYQVTGQADVINNHSSKIEAGHNMVINVDTLNNINNYLETEEVLVSEQDVVEYAYNNNGGVRYRPDDVTVSCFNHCGGRKNYLTMVTKKTGEDSDYFHTYRYKESTYQTQITSTAPAELISGGNLVINANIINNNNSHIIAGKTLLIDANTLNNISVIGEQRITRSGTRVYSYKYKKKHKLKRSSYYTGHDYYAYNPADEVSSLDLQNAMIKQYEVINTHQLDKNNKRNVDVNLNQDVTNVTATINSNKSIDTTGINEVSDIKDVDVSVSHSHNSGPNVSTNLTDNQIDATGNNQATSRVEKASDSSPTNDKMGEVNTVSTVEPNTHLPNNSLYVVNKDVDKNYLIETDPRFTNRHKWLSSDYMFKQLKVDPNNLQKRLGDGYYEQKLIREQVTALTGQRYLGDYSNDIEQYQALMNSGVVFGQRYGLSIGVELSPEQMMALTTDMVWMVSKAVTIDGVTYKVLVPQVYVVNRPHITAEGALLAGRDVSLKTQDDINSSGSILGKQHVEMQGDHINNQGNIAGNQINITAKNDITSNGSITAEKLVSLNASHDINLTSTSHTEEKINGIEQNIKTVIDKVSSIAVNKGDISIKAGNDINMTGALVVNNGENGLTAINAGHDINLITVNTQDKEQSIKTATNYRKTDIKNVVGSEIFAKGDVSLTSDNRIFIEASNITSDKALLLQSNNIDITTAEERSQLDTTHKVTTKGLLSKQTTITHIEIDDTTQKGSNLTGDSVTMKAGDDLSVTGSQVMGTKDVNLTAGNDVTVDAAQESYYTQQQTITKKSGLMSGGSLGFTIGKEKSDLKQTDAEQAYVGSTIGSTEGNVNITSDKTLTVKGSDVIAKQDINLTGENVTLESHDAQITYKEEYKYQKSGLTVAITGTVADVYDAAKSIERAKEKDNDKLLALQSIKSGLTAVQAVQDLQLKNDKGDTQASIGVSVTVGTQKTEREVNQEQHNVVSSGVSAGQHITITATGNEQKTTGDITVKGSDIKAGNDITLDADRDLNVTGSVNTQHSDKDEKSYGGGVGISLSIGGDKSGLRFTGNANFSRERENADGSAWSESVINAGDKLTVKTGNDANVVGGQLKGNAIKLDIGNNLNIQSLQDTDNYDYDKISASVSGSGGVGGFSANLALSKTDIESNWASVTDQSGIFAGKGGFDITVGNNTDLQGAVIASNAEDKTHNKLDTGTISFSDIENKADFDVSHVSINIGTSGVSPTAGAPTLYHNSGSDHSTTKSAVEDGTLIVRNQDEQKQDVNQLSRDTDNANNPLGQIFDKQKELDRMEAIELVKDIAAQAKDITNKYDRIQAKKDVDDNPTKLDKLRQDAQNEYDKLSPEKQAGTSVDELYAKRYYAAVSDQVNHNKDKNQGGMGSSVSKGIDAATSIVTGLITGDITGGLAGASAPYLAEKIKNATTNADGSINKEANLVAHAILGAAVAQLQGNSALAGGAGSAIGEKAADIIFDLLYSKDANGNQVDKKDLSQADKENISALAQLASGLAVAGSGGDMGDIGTAVAGSKNAVENNRLSTLEEKKRIDELAGNDPREKLFYQAAACALIKCSAEFAEDDPQKALYQQMEALGNSEALQSYKDELAEQYKTNIAQVSTYLTGGSTVTYETVEKLFEYTSGDQFVDSAAYINNEYSVKTRLGGVLQLGFALTEGVGGIALIPTCETGIGCIASGAMIWHAADTGGTALSVIIDGKQYTAKTAKSLSNLLNISERDAEMLFDLSGMAASLKSTSSLFKNSVANTSKLSAKEIEQIKNNLPTTINKNTRLTEDKIKEILATEKNNRPDPSTYMSKAEIEAHLAKFDDGAVRFTSKAKYDEYGTYGSKDGFVMPKSEFENVMIQSKGDLRIVEQKLGLEKGYLSNSDTLIVYVEKENISSLKIPSGNEAGANQYWLPGGKTSGGISEAIMDFSQKPKVDIIDLETIKKQLSGN